MSYLVFARKWRPQAFEDVIGQEHITLTLKNAVSSGRIAHAYLFTGPRGIGKTSTARIFAKALNCKDGPAAVPCNTCASCKEITNSTSLDVLEIDGASNTSVDQIRDLRENVKLSPSSGKFKIYIIDEVHMLSTSAFNALLKTLEEPPPHVKFIFATTQAYKVLPTIISRCQRFDFRRIPKKHIMAKLEKISASEQIEIDEEALFCVASAADGSLRDAESILDQLMAYKKGKIAANDVASLLGMVEAEAFFDFTNAVLQKDAGAVLELINRIVLDGKDLFQFMSGLIEHFRNLIVLKVSSELTNLISQTQENIEKLLGLSGKFSQQELLYSFSVLTSAQEAMRRSNNMRIPLEMSAVKLTKISELKTLPQMLEELKRLNQKQALKDSSEMLELREPSAGDKGEKFFQESVSQGTEPSASCCGKNEKLDKNSNSSDERVNLKSAAKDDLGSRWIKFIEDIKNESLLAGLYLNEGKILKAEENYLVLGFHNGNNFHLDYLQKKENKSLIEERLSMFFSRKMRISFVKLEEPEGEISSEGKSKEESKGEIDTVVDSALKIFGGKIVGDT